MIITVSVTLLLFSCCVVIVVLLSQGEVKLAEGKAQIPDLEPFVALGK